MNLSKLGFSECRELLLSELIPSLLKEENINMPSYLYSLHKASDLIERLKFLSYCDDDVCVFVETEDKLGNPRYFVELVNYFREPNETFATPLEAWQNWIDSGNYDLSIKLVNNK